MKKILAFLLMLSVFITACGPARHIHTVVVKDGAILSESAIKCPKCGSDNLSSNNRGYSLGKGITGGLLLGPAGLLLGVSGNWKTVFTCMSCAYTWRPDVRKVKVNEGSDSTYIINEPRFQDGIYH